MERSKRMRREMEGTPMDSHSTNQRKLKLMQEGEARMDSQVCLCNVVRIETPEDIQNHNEEKLVRIYNRVVMTLTGSYDGNNIEQLEAEFKYLRDRGIRLSFHKI